MYEEDEERKSTFLKNKYGNYEDWAVCMGTALLVMGIFLLVTILVFGITAIGDYYEVKAFNRIHGTDYTFGEWFWAERTIKDYHMGTVQNFNVDLNINDLKGG